jgi:UDP-N-acetylglucosamine 2-epimerase
MELMYPVLDLIIFDIIGYSDTVMMESKVALILTDSGGVQK